MKYLSGSLLSILLAGAFAPAAAQLDAMFDHMSFLGPRAGISIVPNDVRGDKATAPVNSLFGWVMDIRYASARNFEGYAEGGVFLEGVENGVVYPEVWGYFGMRQKQGFGIGLGPAFSTYGVGLGIAPAYYFRLDRLMIPVTFNTVITGGKPRHQLHVGFGFASK